LCRLADPADLAGMDASTTELIPHPAGEQSLVEEFVATADTFGGRVHVEWDLAVPVTPLGQMPFFIDYLKQGGLFDACVADCPLLLRSPNAPRKRDLLGTLLLSTLAGHYRYAQVTSLRCDAVDMTPTGIEREVTRAQCLSDGQKRAQFPTMLCAAARPLALPPSATLVE
jgi:hypothetical protein